MTNFQAMGGEFTIEREGGRAGVGEGHSIPSPLRDGLKSFDGSRKLTSRIYSRLLSGRRTRLTWLAVVVVDKHDDDDPGAKSRK